MFVTVAAAYSVTSLSINLKSVEHIYKYSENEQLWLKLADSQHQRNLYGCRNLYCTVTAVIYSTDRVIKIVVHVQVFAYVVVGSFG